MYAYRKSMPRANKHLEEKWVKHCQKLHRKRLTQMKPAIDNKTPQRFGCAHSTTPLHGALYARPRFFLPQRTANCMASFCHLPLPGRFFSFCGMGLRNTQGPASGVEGGL